MARITLTVDDVVVYLETGRGRSAYESYLRTTDDDPPLTEEEWANAFAEAKAFAEDIQDLKDRVGYLENHSLVMTSTDW